MADHRSGSALLFVIIMLSGLLFLIMQLWFKTANMVDAMALYHRNEIRQQITVGILNWGVALYREYQELIDLRVLKGSSCYWHITHWPQCSSELYSAHIRFEQSIGGAIACLVDLVCRENICFKGSCVLRLLTDSSRSKKLIYTSNWKTAPASYSS